MNARERFRETLLFGSPDKIPFVPGGPRESTLKAWREQGLPADRNHFEVLQEILGIQVPARQYPVHVDVSFKMIPTFEEKVLEHKDGHYVVQDWMGAITEISDEFDYTYIRAAKDFVTRKWHKFPVENRDDWENMKWRFDPKAEGRFGAAFEKQCATWQERDFPVGIHFNAPFWQLREWCGFENLCMLMIDDPDFVTEMVEFWTDFILDIMKTLLERIQLDCVGMSEDMAYKVHSMISPEMTRKFLQPAYDRWVPEAKRHGCEVIFMDSDGYVDDLMPIWVESGINASGPVEVAAENDIVDFRNRYGNSMAYIGGIDKRAIAKGGSVIRDELMRVVPPLLKDGGFIPSCDHGVPPDISWTNFVEYSRLLAQLTGWL